MAKVHISLDAVQISISGELVSIQTGEDSNTKVSIETDADMVAVNPDDIEKATPIPGLDHTIL